MRVEMGERREKEFVSERGEETETDREAREGDAERRRGSLRVGSKEG